MANAPQELALPYASDMHVHLRQGILMEGVTPTIRSGGVDTVFVMPNLIPPIKTTDQALAYKAQLLEQAPDVTFLMSLYLSPELTPEEIHKAAKAGIVGVKSYPRGVTTNSESGIESYTAYYPVFKAMEEVGMVLNLHGEVPSDPSKDICILNAEAKFLAHLKELHTAFPKLRIVLEHATTKEAVDMVKSLGSTVGCTITVHHLQLVIDNWAGYHHHFCKPVAKFPHDRDALRAVIKEGHPRFFLGSDSAPHPRSAKEKPVSCAGVFTTPLVMPYLATILESFGALDKLRGFACDFGRRFYQLPAHPAADALPPTYPTVRLVRIPTGDGASETEDVRALFTVPQSCEFVSKRQGEADEREEVVPFWAGHVLTWRMAN
ncbi:dihydroorotase [Dimargaris xerosporica]|nr:dihydroorotase [Dimargaris xerosporica]